MVETAPVIAEQDKQRIKNLLPDDGKLTVSVETAAKLMGISRPLAYRLCSEKKMCGLLVMGHRYLISKVALEKALIEGFNPYE